MRPALLALWLGLATVIGGCTPTANAPADAAAGGDGAAIPGLPGSDRRTVPAQPAGDAGGLLAWSAEQSVTADAPPVVAAAAPLAPPPAETAPDEIARQPSRGLFGLGRRAAPAAPAPQAVASEPPEALPAPLAATDPPPPAVPSPAARPDRKPLFGFLGGGRRKAAEPPVQAMDADGNPVQSATLDMLPATGPAPAEPAIEAATAPTTDEATPPLTEAAAPVPDAQKSTMQRACEGKGGTYSRLNGAFLCVQPTRDGGKACRTGRDCEGQCLARSRSCAPISPLTGCHDIIQDNGVRMTLCIE